MDPTTSAKSAREQLAQALAVLQAPGVPPNIMVVAEPIALAMGALHVIEATNGAMAAQQGPMALDHVRRALALVQANMDAHPAVNQAMEKVATALGVIHILANTGDAAPAPAAAAPPAPAAAAPPAPAAPQPDAAAAQQAAAQAAQEAAARQAAEQQRAAEEQAARQAAEQEAAARRAAEEQAARQAAEQEAATRRAAEERAAAQQAAQEAAARQAAEQQAAWAAQQAAAQQAAAQQAAAQQAAAPQPTAPAPAGAQVVNAELGAHSLTNFYKGLAGNDVVDDGGIFVATYKVPPIGTPLVLQVSLPGGYEFEAHGTVRWVSDASGGQAGFGAQFTTISQEARQLVYRYVRNREPMFYDDL